MLWGTHCLRWQNDAKQKSDRVRLRSVPDDWSEFYAVELWYNARYAPKDFDFELICGRREANVETEEVERHMLTAQVRMLARKGWQRLRLPLRSFRSTGLPDLAKVKSVDLIVRDDGRFDFFLDGIALLKPSKNVARR